MAVVEKNIKRENSVQIVRHPYLVTTCPCTLKRMFFQLRTTWIGYCQCPRTEI